MNFAVSDRSRLRDCVYKLLFSVINHRSRGSIGLGCAGLGRWPSADRRWCRAARLTRPSPGTVEARSQTQEPRRSRLLTSPTPAALRSLSHNTTTSYAARTRGGSRKKYLGAWTLIIWEATTAKRNYDRSNYIKHVENLGLSYPEKYLGGPGQDLGACAPPPGPNVEPPLARTLSPIDDRGRTDRVVTLTCDLQFQSTATHIHAKDRGRTDRQTDGRRRLSYLPC